jgi:thioesterase domain-containing protein
MFNALLEELSQKSVKINFRDGKLKFEGPEDNITPELIEKLRKHKESLIRLHWPQECVNMMPINPVGNKIPFVLVYFEIMNYPLSEYLGKDQPFYGFLHYGSKGEKIEYKDVESFAAAYIVQLQKVLPKGPYLLGGFSFGGILAFEMAIQLQKAGHEVPFLSLLDSQTSEGYHNHSWVSDVHSIVKKDILKSVRGRLIRMASKFTCKLFLSLGLKIPVSLRNYYIVDKYITLTCRYKPGKYNGDILLFRSDTVNPELKYNGWEPYANNIKVINFSGPHLKIAREKSYAEMIGKEFLDHLSRVTNPHF